MVDSAGQTGTLVLTFGMCISLLNKALSSGLIHKVLWNDTSMWLTKWREHLTQMSSFLVSHFCTYFPYTHTFRVQDETCSSIFTYSLGPQRDSYALCMRIMNTFRRVSEPEYRDNVSGLCNVLQSGHWGGVGCRPSLVAYSWAEV